VGIRFGLDFGRAWRMAWGGRVFFATCRRGDVVKNRGRWKLLEGKKRRRVRGGKTGWCRKRHPLEKIDICEVLKLVICPINLPILFTTCLEEMREVSQSTASRRQKKIQGALGESAAPLLAPSDSGGLNHLNNFQILNPRPSTCIAQLSSHFLVANMASFAAACRLSARLTARQLRQDATARGMDFFLEELKNSY